MRLSKVACSAGLVLLAVAPLTPCGAQAPAPYAFVGVSVLPMDAPGVLADHTVVVRGDRIVDVGPSAGVSVPPGATRIEGRGRFLMPGLAELHGHIPPPTAPAALVESVLFLYVANGVTTVRGMLGAPGQIELRARANRGELVAPALYLAGPSFNGNSVDSPEQAARMVREQKATGWDLLKIHPGLTRPEYDAIARTAREVGITFGGHVPADVGLLRVLEAKQETIDHLDGYMEYLDGGKGPIPEATLVEVADRTKAAGVRVVPTMALWETVIGAADLEKMKQYPELRYMPPQQVASWTDAFLKTTSGPQYDRQAVMNIAANRKRLLKVLNDRGVEIVFGTDAPQMFSVPGFSIHREVLLMREAGLTPLEILQTGTRNAGRYFARWDRFGTIRPGQRADLILLEANPLDDLGHLARRAGVMVRGRWLPEQEIQRRLQQIAAKWKSGEVEK